jgi:hypothetical protein
MRRRVVCPRSHPASPHLRRYFVGFAVFPWVAQGSLAGRSLLPGTPGRRSLTPGVWPRCPASAAPAAPSSSPVARCLRWVTVRLARRVKDAAGNPPRPPPCHAPGRRGAACFAIHNRCALPPWPFPDSKPACSAGQNSRTCFITRSEINYFLVITESGYSGLAITESGYSGLLNVTMATAIMTSPMTATIPRHTPIGTTQPPHVRPGTRACMPCAGRFRWVNTAYLMGYTT